MGCLTEAKEPSLTYYLLKLVVRTDKFIFLPKCICAKGNANSLFIMKGFQTIVFHYISASMSSSLLQVFVELRNLRRTTFFIESMGFTCSDSVNRNRVQVLRIPILLLTCNKDWTCNIQMIVFLEP